jgi:hypothetical protein
VPCCAIVGKRDAEDDDDDPFGGSAGSSNYRIGGHQCKGDIDYDLLTRLIMVLALGPDAVPDTMPTQTPTQGVNAGGSGAAGVTIPGLPPQQQKKNGGGGGGGAAQVNLQNQQQAQAQAQWERKRTEIFAQARGSILVFMPGLPEINRLSQLLSSHWKAGGGSGGGNSAVPHLKIMPLHGNLSPAEQKLVFKDASRGELKVVIATNVAEASVTIPDVTVVVDTCRVKEIAFDTELQTTSLTMKFAAQDSLRQRRGRAG